MDSLSCYTDLHDTIEGVIMNALIQPVDQSDLHFELNVHHAETGELIPMTKRTENSPTSIARTRQIVSIPVSSTRYTFLIKLQPPPSNPPLTNVEYVMDVRILNPLGNMNDDDPKTQNILAKVTSSRSGCDETRGYGHILDEGLEITIFFPYSAFQEGYGVQVIAGWARGHEAVTLTHPIYFLPLGKAQWQQDDNVVETEVLLVQEEEKAPLECGAEL